eukprot:3183950-Amphidinium_carterae.1
MVYLTEDVAIAILTFLASESKERKYMNCLVYDDTSSWGQYAVCRSDLRQETRSSNPLQAKELKLRKNAPVDVPPSQWLQASALSHYRDAPFPCSITLTNRQHRQQLGKCGAHVHMCSTNLWLSCYEGDEGPLVKLDDQTPLHKQNPQMHKRQKCINPSK